MVEGTFWPLEAIQASPAFTCSSRMTRMPTWLQAIFSPAAETGSASAASMTSIPNAKAGRRLNS